MRSLGELIRKAFDENNSFFEDEILIIYVPAKLEDVYLENCKVKEQEER